MPPPFEPPFSNLTSFTDLCDFLREEGVQFTADPDSNVVEIPSLAADVPSSLLIRWEWQAPLVQLVRLLFDVPAGTRAATERAIALLNHAAPRAGFAMDPERGFAYYRLTLQRDDRDAISVGQLNRALAATVGSVRDYLPLLYRIAYPPPNATPPEDNSTPTNVTLDDVSEMNPAPTPGPG